MGEITGNGTNKTYFIIFTTTNGLTNGLTDRQKRYFIKFIRFKIMLLCIAKLILDFYNPLTSKYLATEFNTTESTYVWFRFPLELIAEVSVSYCSARKTAKKIRSNKIL